MRSIFRLFLLNKGLNVFYSVIKHITYAIIIQD